MKRSLLVLGVLVGIALMAFAAEGAFSRTQVGEAVPDLQAAGLRGGCIGHQQVECEAKGGCNAGTVFSAGTTDGEPNGWDVYCGGTYSDGSEWCGEYWNGNTGPCSSP